MFTRADLEIVKNKSQNSGRSYGGAILYRSNSGRAVVAAGAVGCTKAPYLKQGFPRATPIGLYTLLRERNMTATGSPTKPGWMGVSNAILVTTARTSHRQ